MFSVRISGVGEQASLENGSVSPELMYSRLHELDDGENGTDGQT
jgi:hypothetical protein